jgi:hypothetical protein
LGCWYHWNLKEGLVVTSTAKNMDACIVSVHRRQRFHERQEPRGGHLSARSGELMDCDRQAQLLTGMEDF